MFGLPGGMAVCDQPPTAATPVACATARRLNASACRPVPWRSSTPRRPDWWTGSPSCCSRAGRPSAAAPQPGRAAYRRALEVTGRDPAPRVHLEDRSPSGSGSETEVTQLRMAVRATPQRPVIVALGFRDGKVVDARVPHAHQPLLVEFPVLVAVGPEPVARVIVMLVSEADGDPVALECPELLDEPVVELLRPFAREKRHDLVTPVDELRPVPPVAVRCVGQSHLLGVTGVPGVFRQPHLLDGGVARERRERRTRGHTFPPDQVRRVAVGRGRPVGAGIPRPGPDDRWGGPTPTNCDCR